MDKLTRNRALEALTAVNSLMLEDVSVLNNDEVALIRKAADILERRVIGNCPAPEQDKP